MSFQEVGGKDVSLIPLEEDFLQLVAEFGDECRRVDEFFITKLEAYTQQFERLK